MYFQGTTPIQKQQSCVPSSSTPTTNPSDAPGMPDAFARATITLRTMTVLQKKSSRQVLCPRSGVHCQCSQTDSKTVHCKQTPGTCLAPMPSVPCKQQQVRGTKTHATDYKHRGPFCLSTHRTDSASDKGSSRAQPHQQHTTHSHTSTATTLVKQCRA